MNLEPCGLDEAEFVLVEGLLYHYHDSQLWLNGEPFEVLDILRDQTRHTIKTFKEVIGICS